MKDLTSKFSPQDVQAYLDTDELVRATVQQIMKDFDSFGIAITFSGDISMAYSEIHGQLVQHLNDLLDRSYSKLIALLYRIDLSEADIKKGVLHLPDYNFSQAMAHLIIERELKKVLSRKFFQ